MNPQSTALPAAPRIVNDVAAPTPVAHTQAPVAPAQAPVAAAVSAADTQSTNMVANIPVHVQMVQAAPAAPTNEDDELDQIMHDVGQELKKDDKKPPKHGLLDFLHQPKPLVKSPLPPNQKMTVAASPAPMDTVAAPALPTPAAAFPQAQAQAASHPKPKRSVPVFVIFVALCVTGFLVAAAIAAYRQS